jgi:uncharacterized protein with FMN-binding domain
MKNVYMIIITVMITFLLSTCGTMEEGGSAGNPLYQAGTYKGSGDGYFGLITVAVTVTENAVTEVEVLSHAETDGIGTAAFEELSQTILYTNSPDIDVIAGATGSSEGFIAAVNDALLKARVE